MDLIEIFLNFWTVKFLFTFYGIDSGDAAISSVSNLLHVSATP